jgi:hypothetical protein
VFPTHCNLKIKRWLQIKILLKYKEYKYQMSDEKTGNTARNPSYKLLRTKSKT